MLDLFSNYSVGDVIIFIVIIALAVKEFLSLCDFFFKKLDDKFTGRYKSKSDKQKLYEEIENLTNMMKEVQDTQKQSQEIMNVLVQSDIEDIRSWVVRQYHYFKKNPELKIDDFEMDCIEKRFQCYEKEGGNSYIHDLVDEIREMHNERI